MTYLRKCLAFYVLIVIVIVISRLAVWVCLPHRFKQQHRPSGTGLDYRTHYLPVATSVAEGSGFVQPLTRRLDTRYPPGYPAYLAGALLLARALSLDLVIVRLALDNLIIVPLTWLGLLVLWRLLGMSFGWAFFAALAYIIYPPYIWATIVPTTIPLFTCLLVWACVAWACGMRSPKSLVCYPACGLGLGLAMLVRPTPLLLPLGMAIVMLWRKVSWKHVICLLVCTILVVAPWMLAASLTEGHFVTLSTGGPRSFRHGMSEFPGNSVAQVFLRQEQEKLNPAKFLLIAAKEFGRSPASSLSLWGRKALRCWYGTDPVTNWTGRKMEWLLAEMSLLVLAAGAWGWWRLLRSAQPGIQRTILLFDMLALLLYFWLLTTMVASLLRYMVPVVWICIGYAVFGFGLVGERSSTTPSRSSGRAAPGQPAD